MSRALAVACVSAAVVVAAAAGFRLAADPPGAIPLPDRLLVVLVAAALLLIAALTLRRSPAIAWPATALAAALGSVEVVAAVRALEPVASGSGWRDLSMVGGLALVIAAVTAAVYAARRLPEAALIARLGLVVVVAGAVATTVAAIWAVIQSDAAVEEGQLSPLRIAVRIGLATMAAGILVGIGRDLGPRVRRSASGARAEDGASGRRLWHFAGLLRDELLPGRVADRRSASESERARLAADLHALVLPDLRRAAARAEAAGMPSEVQVDLRRALEDVEQLMHERQSIVLDQFGLVAALEWLAERTEERSSIRVQLELDGPVPDAADAIDPAVARAAFRITLLALDNVVRHARATVATIRVSWGAEGLRLAVIDDGTSAGDSGLGKFGRGIADMRSEAYGTGGSLKLALDAAARVEAVWPLSTVAANHATAPSEIANRRAILEP